MSTARVIALYGFVALDDCESLAPRLLELCRKNGIRGTLLLAHEGINGTVAGPPAGVQALLDFLSADARFHGLDVKESVAGRLPFHRMKVRVKREIVTLGLPDVDPTCRVGTYVEGEAWNALLADPEVIVIDTRNDYEVRLGTFSGAVNPGTSTFTEFPAYVREHLDPRQHKKIAMYCTGGIRCEKASSFMLGEGFEQVFHLRGGILRYLETVPQEQSLWQGDCFVFDERVAVTHALAPTQAAVCFNCRTPLTREDQQSADFEPEVSCPHCRSTLTAERRASLQERTRQIALAATRGEQHLGDIAPLVERRRAEKKARRAADRHSAG